MKTWVIAHQRQLLVRFIVLSCLVLLCIWGIRPFTTVLEALGRANSGASEFEDIQIAETSAKKITHSGIVSLDNCNGWQTENSGPNASWADRLIVSVTDPFNTDVVRLLLDQKYRFPGWVGGGPINILDPAENTQISWSQDEQQWTGEITSKGQPGTSTYLVTAWFEPKLVSSKNLGCLF